MQLSKQGLDLIKSFEGLRLKAYKPLKSEKYYTIGYGHYGEDVREGETITKAEAIKVLQNDVQGFVYGVNQSIIVVIDQKMFDALVSFAYNVGLHAFESSTLLTYVNEKKFEQASNEFMKWVHDNGKVIQGLVNRREKEKTLFDEGLKALTPSPTVNYTVVEGDTLSEIALKHKTTVKGMLLLNPQIENPNVIKTGQVLNIPNHEYPQVSKPLVIDYKIGKGDNLTKIAENHQCSVSDLLRLNPKIKNKDLIYRGDIIKVPNK